MLKIKEVREHKKLSQDEVVRLSGIPKRSYLNYENGQTDVPVSKLQNIARVLGVSISDLLNESNSSIANDEQDEYKIRGAEINSIRRDIRAVNENLLALSEGVKVNFERIAMGIDQGLKNDLTVIQFIEQINVKDITSTTDRLTRYFENK